MRTATDRWQHPPGCRVLPLDRSPIPGAGQRRSAGALQALAGLPAPHATTCNSWAGGQGGTAASLPGATTRCCLGNGVLRASLIVERMIQFPSLNATRNYVAVPKRLPSRAVVADQALIKRGRRFRRRPRALGDACTRKKKSDMPQSWKWLRRVASSNHLQNFR